MSSSFIVRRGPPDDTSAVLAALDRPGLRWADGELDELAGPWPDGVILLWIPGASTRGVEVTTADGAMTVRILAMSSREDYDLAFRLIEVLGQGTVVEPEEGEPFAAAEVRARCDEAWITRTMAAGAAGIGAALARGKRVTVSGPGTSVRIDPVVPFDAPAFLETMRNAQAAAAAADTEHTVRDGKIVEDEERTPWEEIEDGDLLAGEQEHQAELQKRDGKLSTGSRTPPRRRGRDPLFFVIVALVLVPAIIVRIVTWPFRISIRERRAERRDERFLRERQTCRDEVVRETAHLADQPADLEARRRRADRLRRLGHRAAAERDLAAVLDAMPDRDPARGAVLAEHAVVLDQLGCPSLAAAARAAAVKLGVEVDPARSKAAAGDLFRIIAGLGHD